MKTILWSAGVGAVVASLFTYFIISQPKTTAELIKEFYLIENAVHVSPHSLRKRMDKGDTSYTLVDLRSPAEYAKEHITTAVNIPAYKDPDTSISLESDREAKERLISEFRQLPKGSEIIVYCYSMPCMTGRKVGKLLSENGIFVKHLGIGWNEWRYFWQLWNHDAETPSKVEDYVTSGQEPGKPKTTDGSLTPCGEGELGC